MRSAESRPYEKECEEALKAAAKELKPLFARLGYYFSFDDTGVSSGGPYANGFFYGPACRIGIIWRSGSGFGEASYEVDGTTCGHDELLTEIGVRDEAWLTFNEKTWTTTAKKGETVIQAFAHDIDVLLAEYLRKKRKEFTPLVERARERTLAKMFGEKGRNLARGS